ncbi:P-loop containing nucleoside triphosphate hydrolase protein [Kalaharituber pfeilii]|nr:P-loop containing nucleoside triphosphate hydrolase protein [Kalaharituber pfeilii]
MPSTVKADIEEAPRGKKGNGAELAAEGSIKGNGERKRKKEKKRKSFGQANDAVNTNTSEKGKEELNTESGLPKEKKNKKKRKRVSDTHKIDNQADHGEGKRRKPSPSLATDAPSEALSSQPSIDEPLNKHPTIFKKFQALLRSNPALSANPAPPPEHKPVEVPEELQPQGLHPLPQPASSKDTSKPHFSLDASLPLWLSAPTLISPAHTVPFLDLALSDRIKNRLSSYHKFEKAFAVQAAIVPLLLETNSRTYHDVLVSAPTGSGKTLSYILPIVQDLSSRTVTRLRALIIVPTRELVSQVRDTAESLASGLKVGIAWGARSLEFERTMLIEDNWEDDSGRPDIFDEQHGEQGRYSSKVDILICTPGRLVEHLTTTPGFTLTSLRWLVVDEADRLLAQSFQEWLGILIKALESGARDSSYKNRTLCFNSALGIRENHNEIVRKVILSATMTKDVGKLAGLKLRKPRLVVIEEQTQTTLDNDNDDDEVMADAPEYSSEEENDVPEELFTVPSTLTEHYISVPVIEDKPLYLIQLLIVKDIKSGVLVFTKSNENAARLARLMELLLEGTNTKVGLVSGELNKAGRKRRLAEFKRNEIDILVCSDLISRGMDLPAVDHVINYDIAATTRSYVHRVGRTARAGKDGDAWSLVAKNEARWFWRNIGRGIKRGNDKTVLRTVIELAKDEEKREKYKAALLKLGQEVKGGGRH